MKKQTCIIILLLTCRICSAQQWTQIFSPASQNLRSCSFINQDTGWVISGYIDSIYKTTDGGLSWITQNYPPDPHNNTRLFTSVDFIDANVGIIGCGNYFYLGADSDSISTVLWTINGGNLWEYKDLGDWTNDFVLDAKLADQNTAYTIGQYGLAKKTIDGGLTWIDVNYFSTGPYTGTKLFPINKDTVYFAGLDNIFFSGGAFGKTTNGGSSWSVDTISNNLMMQAIYFYDFNKGWLGGEGGEIKITNDAGVTWTNCNTGITNDITDIAFVDSLNGWATVSDGKIIHSTDGGLNWNIEYTDTIPLYSISFDKASNTGYAVGRYGRILKYLPTTSIENLNEKATFKICPNPFTNEFSIQTNNNKLSEIIIYDILSRKVLEQKFTNSASISTVLLEKGIYLYEVRNKDGLCKKGKLVKD